MKILAQKKPRSVYRGNMVAELTTMRSIRVSGGLSNSIRQSFKNQEQAQLSIFKWIESWYNRRRRHSALDYQTIEEPERSGARRSQFERTNYKFKNAA